jgi:hypothetical protein
VSRLIIELVDQQRPVTDGSQRQSLLRQKNKVPMDFVSTHDYGVKGLGLDEYGNQQLQLLTEPGAIIDGVRGSRAHIAASSLPKLPLHYTEWSASYSQRDPIHDSYISAPTFFPNSKALKVMQTQCRIGPSQTSLKKVAGAQSLSRWFWTG